MPAAQDAVSEVAGGKRREWELRAEAEEIGAGGNHHCSFPRLNSWRLEERVMVALSFFPFSYLPPPLGFFPFVISLLRFKSSKDMPGQREKGVPATCRHIPDSGQEKQMECTPP